MNTLSVPEKPGTPIFRYVLLAVAAKLAVLIVVLLQAGLFGFPFDSMIGLILGMPALVVLYVVMFFQFMLWFNDMMSTVGTFNLLDLEMCFRESPGLTLKTKLAFYPVINLILIAIATLTIGH